MSVSISAKISPSSTLSPTFLIQVATVPSVIVSLKRGIVITCTPLGISTPTAAVVSVTTSSLTSFMASVFSAFAFPPIKVEISSPSSPIIANKVSTGEVSPS